MRRLPLSPGIRTCTCFGVRRQHDASSGFLAKGVWVMRKTGMIGIVLAASMSLGACTTYDRGYGYGYDDNRDIRGAATGAAVGAAVGAGVGAVVEGLDPLEGAAGGAVIGGIVGAIASDSDPRSEEHTSELQSLM